MKVVTIKYTNNLKVIIIDNQSHKSKIKMKKCVNNVESLQFILQVLGGKWKLHILSILYFGKKRFKELEREIEGISAKMLIKELKDLEAAGIVNRQTFNTVPITVEYSLTKEGLTMKPLLDQMNQWATEFQQNVNKKSSD
ncbi:winged helix-turn-helix transcriptional regulator [Pseudopedobacter beijingensis]|uniref:Winged helix-turn-helix transcriptional regulator n=1 Tax=Pseudopedobacter beijingensis TaxID=1207056 RepID=A0ABW4I9F0_9SPHI